MTSKVLVGKICQGRAKAGESKVLRDRGRKWYHKVGVAGQE